MIQIPVFALAETDGKAFDIKIYTILGYTADNSKVTTRRALQTKQDLHVGTMKGVIIKQAPAGLANNLEPPKLKTVKFKF